MKARLKTYRPLRILGTDIPPGKKTVLNLDIARLHTRTKLEVPIIIQRAREDGPVLLLNAGIHGDEVNGVEIVRQAITGKINVPEKGTVICIPVLNIFGFLNKERAFPDGKDLNRVFPGTKNGSLASRFAYFFMKEIIPHVDYCVDFHSGGASRFNAPHLRISDDKGLMILAKKFGARFIMISSHRDRSFREAASSLGKPVLLFEGGMSLNFDQDVTMCALRGVKRLMHHLGMRDWAEEPGLFQYDGSLVLQKSAWLRARYSGLFRAFIKEGARLVRGQVIGNITDPYGSLEHTVKATHSCYAIGVNHSPIVNQGDAIFNLGEV